MHQGGGDILPWDRQPGEPRSPRHEVRGARTPLVPCPIWPPVERDSLDRVARWGAGISAVRCAGGTTWLIGLRSVRSERFWS